MRSIASSVEAESVDRRQPERRGPDLPPMAAAELDLVAFYHFLLRSEDRGFAAQVAAFLKRDPTLSEQADRELRALPRASRTSPAAIRAFGSMVEDLGLESA